MLIKANYFSLSPRRFIAGTKNSYGIEALSFEFSSEWDGLKKTVTFYPVTGKPVAVSCDSASVTVPAEVMRYPGVAQFTLSGQKDGKSLISVTGYLDILEANTPGGGPALPPSQEEVESVVDLANKAISVAESVRLDADTGKFNGTDGTDGLTPFIGPNGNWWIGTTDTGALASGSGSYSPTVSAPGFYPLDYVSSSAPQSWGYPMHCAEPVYGLWVDLNAGDGNGTGYKICKFNCANLCWEYYKTLEKGDQLLYLGTRGDLRFDSSVSHAEGDLHKYVYVYENGVAVTANVIKIASLTLKESVAEKAISFTVDGNEYRAGVDWTFETCIARHFAPEGATLDSKGYVLVGEHYLFRETSAEDGSNDLVYTRVSGKDKIENGGTYVIPETFFVLPSFGYSNDPVFAFDKGMTWAEWKASEYNVFDFSGISYGFRTMTNVLGVTLDVAVCVETPIEGICHADGTPVKDEETIEAIGYRFDELDYYEEKAEEISLSFTVDGNAFVSTYETWGEFADAADSFRVDTDDSISYKELIVFLNGSAIGASDAIVSNGEYLTKISFTVDIGGDTESFESPIGYTWQTWAASSYDKLDWYSVDEEGYIVCSGGYLCDENGEKVLGSDKVSAGYYSEIEKAEADEENSLIIAFPDGNRRYFEAEENMTWKEWVESDYNDGSLYISDETVFLSFGGAEYKLYDGDYISMYSKIVLGYEYGYDF